MDGRLVVLEGLDGSGKTSVWRALQEAPAARAASPGVVWGRDPGDTRVGRRLREILLDPESGELAPATELLLYLAARAQLVHERVAPALAAGALVVLDRYWISTLAYQGGAGLLGAGELRELAGLGLGPARYPDRVVWLDVPAATGWERARRRGAGKVDRMEARGPAYLEAVRQRYETELARLPPTVEVVRLDATRPLEEVCAQAIRAVF